MLIKSSLLELLEGGPKLGKESLPGYRLFCDMDGVLTDFDSRFEHYTGFLPVDYQTRFGKTPFWQRIEEVGEVYWSEMDWMPEGKELWSLIRTFNPTILSSPSRDKLSRTGKIKWVEKNLLPKPEVILVQNKSQYSGKNNILIDDLGKNLLEWEKAGGIAIKCSRYNMKEVLKKLAELGYERNIT